MRQKNKYTVPLEIGFWITLYIIWVLVFQNRTITITRTLGVEFCYLVFIALNYYATINYLIPGFLNRKRYATFIIIFILFTAIAALLRSLVSYYISMYWYHLPTPDTLTLYSVSLLNIFVWTSILVAGKMMIDRAKNQRYTEEVEKEKIKHELDFLKSQHNPHFLFNSLNSLYFQIDKTNSDARGTLLKLSEMLRYQLYECNADRIPIDNELNYLKSYIELQRLRLDENYTINFRIEENVKDFEIAPLLLIPLVENAFKHVSHFINKPNKINVTLSYSNRAFICEVSNTSEQQPDREGGGIGLKNLERRLEIMYPGRFDINISEEHNSFCVTLKINTVEN
ncbi:MAG TPA: histidine kinase [Bacteroidia bacterium]|nr:histidine kinase [Bacteroidia bacterium]